MRDRRPSEAPPRVSSPTIDLDGHGAVLVVEHEPGVAELERLYLTREGYVVHVEDAPGRAVDTVRRLGPDAVVLDLSAPDVSATALYGQVVDAAGTAPVVCLVPAGTSGPGVHTVARPFGPRILVAALRQARRGVAADASGEVVRAGQVILDPGTRSTRAAGVAVALTGTEFDLLAFLMGHPGRVYTRGQLLAAVWGPAGSAGARTVDVHVAQLRAKLGPASPLRTVRGVGYAADAE